MTRRLALSALSALSALLVSLPAWADCPPTAGACQALIENGSTGAELDLVLVGDGYTADQQALFFQHAQQVSSELFAVTPYAERAGLVNVWALFSPSNQSGSTHPELGTSADTAYGSYYNCANIQRLICADNSKVLADVNPRFPQHDLIAVIVNDTTYGGAGGTIPTVSVDPNAVEILRHELGHTLGGLADEYSDAYPGYPPGDYEPNVASSEHLSPLKWDAWVTPGTPIPTPANLGQGVNNPIGAFEGARYLSTGMYRPSSDCRMRELGVDFCSVCSEALTLGISKLARLFDETTPNADTGCVPTTGTSTFAVAASVATLSGSWTLDGAPIGSSSLSIDLSAADLSAGQHTLEITVIDQTPLVKNDPDHILSDTYSWTVEVTQDCVPSTGGAGGASGASGSGGSSGSGGDAGAAGSGGTGATAATGGSAGEAGSSSGSSGSGGTSSVVKKGTNDNTSSCSMSAGVAGSHGVALVGLAFAAALLRRRRS